MIKRSKGILPLIYDSHARYYKSIIRFDTEEEAALVGYIVQKNDKMWDIAKRYRTTVENIMEINALTSDSIKPDDRLIIARM